MGLFLASKSFLNIPCRRGKPPTYSTSATSFTKTNGTNIYQNRDIDTSEGALIVRERFHTCDAESSIKIGRSIRNCTLNERIGSVLYLHGDSFHHRSGRRDIEEVQDEGLLLPKRLAGREQRDERVADLPGGAGQQHLQRSGRRHRRGSSSSEAND